jgi:hypothetical protein
MNDWKFIYTAERGHCADFHETQNLAISICGHPYRPTGFYRNRKKIVENTSNFFFKPLSKECLSQHRFQRNSQVLYGIMWVYFTRREYAVASRLRPCDTRRKVAGSIPNSVIGIFHWRNPSGRTVTLGLTHPLTEMSTRGISWEVKAASA